MRAIKLATFALKKEFFGAMCLTKILEIWWFFAIFDRKGKVHLISRWNFSSPKHMELNKRAN